MKKPIVFALLLNATLLFFVWRELSVAEGGVAEPCASDPTRFSIDANGDGSVDIADPVHVLNFLFAGQEPPRVCLAQGDSGLEAQVAELLGRVAVLEAKTAPLSVGTFPELEGQTLRISGVNLQIVDGSGATESTSGSGNLIVGYNELRESADERTGSHNVVVGSGHNYTRFGGLVAGRGHTASGDFATVTGGQENTASGKSSSVSGGLLNEARADFSVISGGFFNVVEETAVDGTISGASEQVLDKPGGHLPAVRGEKEIRLVAAGFSPLGRNPETDLEEYRHVPTQIDFVLVEGGTFSMGSPENEPNRSEDEGPVHDVTLTPFLLSKTEVTQAQYELVMGANPSQFTGDGNRPVESVSWDELHAPNGFLARTGLGLPSEAQWEFAARGFTSTAFSFGDACNAESCDPCEPAESFMWWCANAGDTTHPVGEKEPNPFGLFDMHGNVFEWCEDVFDAAFYGQPEAAGPNPVATAGSALRVFRGGSFIDGAVFCRSAFRNGSIPSLALNFVGFRLARPLP